MITGPTHNTTKHDLLFPFYVRKVKAKLLYPCVDSKAVLALTFTLEAIYVDTKIHRSSSCIYIF